MESDIQRRARLLLASLAAVPVIAGTVANAEVQPNAYRLPYGDDQAVDFETGTFTGLTQAEIRESRELINTLNALDVVTVDKLNLTKAKPIPYRYNMPEQQDVQNARIKNLERLAKLRSMIEAAK